MERRILLTKIEKILLIQTAAFLCVLLGILLYARSAKPVGGRYTVETERFAAVSEIISERVVININIADAEALEDLPGIGPALAQKILDYRTEHGPFSTLEDLKEVSGIGEAKLAELKGFATVE